jgi:hypothetical protein
LHNFEVNKNRDFIDIFKGQNLIEFSDRFKTDLDCKEYLAQIKWKDGFECTRCGHGAAQQRRDFSRTCNICGHTESATADTLFHRVRFGVRKAFFICFEMAATTKGLWASYTGVRFGISHHRHMAGLPAAGKEVRHRTDTGQRRIELQGTAYHDPPDKIMDKVDLPMGERFQRGQVF